MPIKVKYTTSNLPFKFPFTISRGTKTHQRALIVELEFHGLRGYGEAPDITYYNIPVEKMISDLENKKQMVENFSFIDPQRFWHYLHHLFPNNNFLVCALDIAAWDLFGKMRQQPLYKIWNLKFENLPLTDYTIGIDAVPKMIEKMREKPWPIYKIKLGTDRDIEIVTALRENTEAILRVDANAAWSAEEALHKIPLLQSLGVEFIEQPLKQEDWPGMRTLYQKSQLPLLADESCATESDVNACRNHFHGINIKLTKCGGITPALRMITEARQHKMKVMAGSMNESSIGTAAVAHMLPLLDYVDMDGPLLLDEDLATGIEFEYGRVRVSGKPGLGVDLLTPIFSNDPFSFS